LLKTFFSLIDNASKVFAGQSIFTTQNLLLTRTLYIYYNIHLLSKISQLFLY